MAKCESWIMVYTDGLVKEGVQNGVLACVASVSANKKQGSGQVAQFVWRGGDSYG